MSVSCLGLNSHPETASLYKEGISGPPVRIHVMSFLEVLTHETSHSPPAICSHSPEYWLKEVVEGFKAGVGLHFPISVCDMSQNSCYTALGSWLETNKGSVMHSEITKKPLHGLYIKSRSLQVLFSCTCFWRNFQVHLQFKAQSELSGHLDSSRFKHLFFS